MITQWKVERLTNAKIALSFAMGAGRLWGAISYQGCFSAVFRNLSKVLREIVARSARGDARVCPARRVAC